MSGVLLSLSLSLSNADPPSNCDPPSFVETQAAVNRLTWGKAPGTCGIHAELLKAGGNSVFILFIIGIIPTDWKRGLVRLEREG